MSYTNQSTIDAVNTLIKNEISKLKFDKTVTAEIESIINYSEGSYYVKYQNNKLAVYSQDPTVTYEVGDAVLVQIPENDLSNKKFIIGRSLSDKMSEAELSYYANKMEEIGALTKIYESLNNDLGNSTNEITIPTNINLSGYDYFKVKFLVKAPSEEENRSFRAEGNLVITTNDTNNSYIITPDMFSGNYYYITNKGEEQEVIFDVLPGVTSLTSFSFDSLKYFTYDNIEIQPMTKVSANAMYSLNVTAPNGISGSSLSLKALFRKESSILNNDDCKFYWYQQDLRHNEKNLAGYGWIPIENNGGDILTLDSLSVETNYRVVINYKNEEVILSKDIALNVGLPALDENAEKVVEYYYSAVDGSFIKTDEKTAKTKAIYYIQTLYNDQVINISKYAGDSSSDSILYTTEGQFIFLYDQNNKISKEEAAIERTFTFDLPEGYAITKWLAPHNTEIKKTSSITIGYNKDKETDNETIGCMLEKMWIDDNGKTLHYHLSDDLDRNKKYFNFIEIELNNGSKIRQDFFFIAEGDIGTNGTGFAVLVEAVDDKGNIAECPEDGTHLKAFVVKDNQIINNNVNYDIEYKWNNGAGPVVDTAGLDQFVGLDFIPLNVEIKEGKKIKLYYNYVKIPGSNSKHREELTSYIKYDREGKNPEYIIGPSQAWVLEPEEDNPPSPDNIFISEELVYKINNQTYKTFCYLDLHDSVDMDAWDGTSVKINGDSSIFSPTIGAGKKENITNEAGEIIQSNVFTGFLMGKNSSDNKIGLYGFKQGNPTFKLTENGDAYFGGDGEFSGTIKIGKTKNNNNPIFHIDSDGNLTMRDNNDKEFFTLKKDGSACFEGTVTATGGTIGGCSIEGGNLKIKNANITSLSVSKITAGTNNKDITFSGNIVAENITATGTINATGGHIGSWQVINQTSLNCVAEATGDSWGGGTVQINFSPSDGIKYIYTPNNKNDHSGAYRLYCFPGNNKIAGVNNIYESVFGFHSIDSLPFVVETSGNIRFTSEESIYLIADSNIYIGSQTLNTYIQNIVKNMDLDTTARFG